jgi:hypothetical protein
MSNCIVYLLNLGVFILGCWEAYVASNHDPTLRTTPGEKQGYAFTVICAAFNITSSILFMYSQFTKKKEEKNEGCLPHVALFVWCCFLFAGIFDHRVRTGPFQAVVLAQFSFMMSILFLACLRCSCTKKTSEPIVNNPITVAL